MEIYSTDAIDFSDLGTQSAQEIKQNFFMDLITVPPSIIQKQNVSYLVYNKNRNYNNHLQLKDILRLNLVKDSTKVYDETFEYRSVKPLKTNLFEEKKDLFNDVSQENFHQQRSFQSKIDPQSHSLYNLLLQKDQQIGDLQQKNVQQRNIQSKQQNKQGINFMTGFTDRTLESLRGIQQWSNIDKQQKNVLQEIIQDTIEFVNSLNEIFRVQQHHVQLCQHRLTQAEIMLKQIEQNKFDQPEVFNLRKMMTQLLESINSGQTQELNAVCLMRDLQRTNLQLSSLQSQFDKVQKRCEHQEQSMDHFKKNYQYSNEENLVFKKNLRKERDQNFQNVKRVNTLEQRLEVLQGQENHKQDQDALRHIIDDMIKENEQNKRKAFSKTQEVVKLEMQINELKDRTNKLNRKNYVLEKQLKFQNNYKFRTFGFNSYDLNGINGVFQTLPNRIPISEDSICGDDFQDIKYVNIWDEIMDKGLPPKKLDYKLDSLKSEYKNILLEVIASGPKSTWDQINKIKDSSEKISIKLILQKDYIMLFMDYFVQYKYLGEKLNTLIRFTCDVSLDYSNEQLMQHITDQLPAIFQCENAHLWLIDQSSATFYTLSVKREIQNALIDSDSFFTLVNTQKIFYAHSTVLEGKTVLVPMYKDANTGKTKFVKDCLLVPVTYEGRIIGVLSLNNFPESQNIVQNSTYLAILTTFLVSRFLQKISQIKMMNYKLKYKNLLHESMIDLCKQKDLFTFQKAVQKHAEALFGVTSTIFYYYHQHQLITYTSIKDKISYSSNLGVAGLAAKTQRNILVNNISQHSDYHIKVDLKSALPVFVIPIVKSKSNQDIAASKIFSESDEEGDPLTQTLAVLEINLNQSAKISLNGKQLDVSQFVGPSDTLQSMAMMFSQIVSLGYHYLYTVANFNKFD